jgi:hypothetical protein
VRPGAFRSYPCQNSGDGRWQDQFLPGAPSRCNGQDSVTGEREANLTITLSSLPLAEQLSNARNRSTYYFFGFGACLAAAALFFFCFACFCAACFWAALGDLSPMAPIVGLIATAVNSVMVAKVSHALLLARFPASPQKSRAGRGVAHQCRLRHLANRVGGSLVLAET